MKKIEWKCTVRIDEYDEYTLFYYDDTGQLITWSPTEGHSTCSLAYMHRCKPYKNSIMAEEVVFRYNSIHGEQDESAVDFVLRKRISIDQNKV